LLSVFPGIRPDSDVALQYRYCGEEECGPITKLGAGAAHPTPYDIVLTDMVLPDGNGISPRSPRSGVSEE